MKQTGRYRRKTSTLGLVETWTESDAHGLARREPYYAGSGEHKTRPLDPSYELIESAALRSDATPCPAHITQPEAQALLELAIERGTVSAATENGYPHCVWARDDRRVYRGRLINRTQGWYKAHPIEEAEVPRGFADRFRGSP